MAEQKFSFMKLEQTKLEDCINFRIKSYIRAANTAISDNIAKEYSAMADELRAALKTINQGELPFNKPPQQK